ncbi:hypothetical protein vBSscSF1_96 [Staphylococcus phage vB-SscS-F1]|nr:hypothetical protein vBApySJF1_96 [Arcanobacterium phage vB-ApyS-JF1]
MKLYLIIFPLLLALLLYDFYKYSSVQDEVDNN